MLRVPWCLCLCCCACVLSSARIVASKCATPPALDRMTGRGASGGEPDWVCLCSVACLGALVCWCSALPERFRFPSCFTTPHVLLLASFQFQFASLLPVTSGVAVHAILTSLVVAGCPVAMLSSRDGSCRLPHLACACCLCAMPCRARCNLLYSTLAAAAWTAGCDVSATAAGGAGCGYYVPVAAVWETSCC